MKGGIKNKKMEYKSFRELNGKILRGGDNLFFKDRVYNVRGRYLNYSGGNNAIFSDLGLGDGIDFCSEAYGYKALSGGFPECNTDDYQALTKVALALFKKIEGITDNTKIKVKKVKEIPQELHIILKDGCDNYESKHNSYKEAEDKAKEMGYKVSIYKLVKISSVESVRKVIKVRKTKKK